MRVLGYKDNVDVRSMTLTEIRKKQEEEENMKNNGNHGSVRQKSRYQSNMFLNS